MERVIQLQQARKRAKEAGFTLVELAIVLVIIGLIIGGVLVGQDLIKAAEIRATVAQIEGYNSAVNTFRGKYKGIPGDIRNVTRFFDTGTWTNLFAGDGDRKLEVCDSAAPDCTGANVVMVDPTGTPIHSGEALQFWHHLSAAELIPGYYNGCPKGGTCVGVAEGAGELDLAFPRSRLDRNGVGVFADGGANYYQIGAAEDPADGTSATYSALASLTPQEAFDLDGKMDDGRPGTGAVIIRSAQSDSVINEDVVAADGSGAATACIDQDVTDPATQWEYALLNPEITCSLRFKMN